MEIVREAARELTGADGASFVLREGDSCHYADESAIAPLWKGRRFPMSACVSGWVMLHQKAVSIDDVYADPRVLVDAYRPTFVKSMAMVPIRTRAPVGAIGVYWAHGRAATPEELSWLQALADSTSVAMENVEVYSDLENRVKQRTAELEVANETLAAQHRALVELQRQKDALSALVVHDLKSPASAILLASSLRLRAPDLSAAERRSWSTVVRSAEHVHRTALNLLDIAGSDDGQLTPTPATIDLGAIFDEVRDLLAPHAEVREQAIETFCEVPPGAVRADPHMLRRVLQNLVDNALRFSPTRSSLRLEARADGGWIEIAVCDEGPGIPAEMRSRIFDRYVQVDGKERTGTNQGLGLTFCRLAVEAHGGAIRIESREPRGSRFCFRLPAAA